MARGSCASLAVAEDAMDLEPLKGGGEKGSRRGSEAEKGRWTSLARSCIVEFAGDLVFVFLGALQASTGGGVIGAAVCHGLTIFVLIAGLGHISGGHFNPAVTLGCLIGGAIPLVNAAFYMASQLMGGLVGAFLVRAVTHGATYLTVIKGGVTVPGPDVYAMEAITCEMILTAVLVTTVLATAVDTSTNALAPLAIGLSIGADILAGASTSGASMNPARSFGPAVAFSVFSDGGDGHWDLHYVYYVGPFLGAALAGGLYRLFFANEEKRLLLK